MLAQRDNMKYDDLELLFDYVGTARPFERSAYLNRKTGESYITSEIGDSEELPDDLGENEDCLEIPHKNELGLGHSLVFQFVAERLTDATDQVGGFFRQAGAYGNFRDLLAQRGLLDDWNKFESDALRTTVLEWCKENNVELQG